MNHLTTTVIIATITPMIPTTTPITVAYSLTYVNHLLALDATIGLCRDSIVSCMVFRLICSAAVVVGKDMAMRWL
ncbi:hypothetical protein BKA58DRAFT_52715 [Alternaria rosae]|uniref:uncharacterized protein n=1 Tax=Alternaria rosae TaxID=1187941 RepID=UPI001E8D7F3A|nr:uncharacterized protein BKA58DRAFT_52715 [Alternaria rosae]KAH6859043.1 hypothetical protein BKA58DRAFT_52715 [Alternaria rosae]